MVVLKSRFVTKTFQGSLDIPEKIILDLKKWLEIEQSLDPKGVKGSTTQKGYQRTLSNNDKKISWLNSLREKIDPVFDEVGVSVINNAWIIDYEAGGYQDPHFHHMCRPNTFGMILNIEGSSDLILQDPRHLAMIQGENFADIVELKKGDWIIFPNYIIHNSRPCKDRRIILVMNIDIPNNGM